MLSPEDNAAVSQVGPGTVMGNFMREYWLPALLSSELPHPDSDPVRVMMLGEALIAFRDTSGKVGLIQNLCPHRGSSLFLGRNEEDGIRCLYHGWKFDVTGACVDMPNEPPESNFKDKVRATAYPCQERGGLVFVYMGPREVPPPLPGIESTLMPEGQYSASAYMVPCNWLQALEGAIDTVHAAFLHGGALEPEWYPEGSFTYYELKQRAPYFASVDTDYGAIYGAYRDAGENGDYWRIGQFLFPCWTNAGSGILGAKVGNQCYVPMDDSHTIVFGTNGLVDGGRGIPGGRRPDPSGLQEMLPNTTDWYGRFNTVYNIENDFLIDREEQREFGSFSGMPFGNGPEDNAVQIMMGTTLDRTIEHLGTSDLMIIRVRQRLLEAARALAEHKSPAPAVDNPELYSTRAGGTFIPKGADWLEHIKDLLPAFVDHPEIDRGLLGGPRIKGRRHKRPGPMF